MRINNRTERYSKMIDGEQAEATDVLDALRRLAEQQEKVRHIARELHLQTDEP